MRELEIAGADSVGDVVGASRRAPPPGAVCANCGAALQGPFCHACGQIADTHKRSIGHLVVEGVENILHLDGRLARTLPDLFLRPGRLARDLMEGRIARHVPPFRLFLVALLIWVFAAEYAGHQAALAGERQSPAQKARLLTPQGRAMESASIRADATKDRDSDLKDAATDRATDLKDPDDDHAKIEARYAAEVGRTQARYAAELAKADRVAQGLPAESDVNVDIGEGATKTWWKAQIHKAAANQEYYLSVMFTWGHRVAFLLLPIVGLTLALVYLNRPGYFIYDHLLVAMNFLSFVFLANAPGFLLPGWWAFAWFIAVALWAPVNLFQTLRGGYGSSRIGAGFKTLIVWTTALFWFYALISALMIFTLTQI